jgi:hypothetical protein
MLLAAGVAFGQSQESIGGSVSSGPPEQGPVESIIEDPDPILGFGLSSLLVMLDVQFDKFFVRPVRTIVAGYDGVLGRSHVGSPLQENGSATPSGTRERKVLADPPGRSGMCK